MSFQSHGKPPHSKNYRTIAGETAYFCDLSNQTFTVKSYDIKNKIGNPVTVKHHEVILFNLLLRNGEQRRQAALFGFRVLRVRAGAAPFPARAAGRGFGAAAPHDGGGGAAAQRPAGVPVEVSPGTAAPHHRLQVLIFEGGI